MDYKKEMSKILADLKKKNHSRRRIEKNLGYAHKSLDQILYAGGNQSIVNKLKEYQKQVDNGTIPAFIIPNDVADYVKKTKSINPERALIDMLILEVAKIKSKVYGDAIDDAIDELEQNAKIALKQIEKA